MTPRIAAAGLAALLLLGGCAGTNTAAYESAMENSAAPDGEAGENAQPPSAGAPKTSDDINQYRVAELKPGHRPRLDSDEGGLWMKMDRAEGELQSSGHLVEDQGLNAYVNGIVCRVAQKHCKDIRVYLVNVPHFNASMAPNGSMQIWTGLLLRVHNEAQLAAVIGHEVAHYLRRHSLQQMRNTIDTAGALTFFNVATLGMTGGLANLVAAGSLTSYSRDFEREADGYSLVLMGRAGYDPREAPKVWQHLIEERRAEDKNVDSAFFLATHPAARERVDAMQRLSVKAKKRWKKANRLGRKSYLAALRPYRARLLRDELQLHRFERSQALLDLLKKDGHNMAELHYFQGELYRLRSKDGDRKLALAAYRKAMRAGKPPAELHRAMGLTLLKENQRAQARKSFQRYLHRNPQAEDAEMIRHLMKQG